MTQNGSATYIYDDENRLIATGGMSYLYDGDGQRVEKCTQGTSPGKCATSATGTLYWAGVGGEVDAETDLSGNVTANYIYFGGGRIAKRDSSKAVHFYYSDHLGSTSLITDANGTMSPHPQAESDYYPYGGKIAITADSTSNHYKFTGKERDGESGLDNFGARYDSSSLGRFMSPDLVGPVAQTNPQLLNLYAYTLNNPLRFVDPNGMAPIEFATFTLTNYRQVSPAYNTLDSALALALVARTKGPVNEPMEPYWDDERPGGGAPNGAPMRFNKPSDNTDTGFTTNYAWFQPDYQSWSISVDFSGSGANLSAKISFTQGFVIGRPGPAYNDFRQTDDPTTVFGQFKFFNLGSLTPEQLKALLAAAKSGGDDPRFKAIAQAAEASIAGNQSTKEQGKSSKKCNQVRADAIDASTQCTR